MIQRVLNSYRSNNEDSGHIVNKERKKESILSIERTINFNIKVEIKYSSLTISILL